MPGVCWRRKRHDDTTCRRCRGLRVQANWWCRIRSVNGGRARHCAPGNGRKSPRLSTAWTSRRDQSRPGVTGARAPGRRKASRSAPPRYSPRCRASPNITASSRSKNSALRSAMRRSTSRSAASRSTRWRVIPASHAHSPSTRWACVTRRPANGTGQSAISTTANYSLRPSSRAAQTGTTARSIPPSVRAKPTISTSASSRRIATWRRRLPPTTT
jgi:hypothetical protein